MVTSFYKNEAKGTEWIDIVFPTREELNEIAQKYNIHQHAIEDCLQPNHLPKLEMIDQVLFMIVRVIDDEALEEADSIQELTRKIAIFYNGKVLITIHRREQSLVYEVKDRFCHSDKSSSIEKLMLEIIRQGVLTYEPPVLEADKILADFESKIFLRNKVPNLIRDSYFLKRKVDVFRRMMLLNKDILIKLKNDEGLEKAAIEDLQDTNQRVLVECEQVRDSLNQLLAIHFNVSSQRVNEVILVLTLFSVFFMPLTFIVGVYGMNFKFMPELNYEYGYYITWGAMLLIVLIIFQWFKRKKWL